MEAKTIEDPKDGVYTFRWQIFSFAAFFWASDTRIVVPSECEQPCPACFASFMPADSVGKP